MHVMILSFWRIILIVKSYIDMVLNKLLFVINGVEIPNDLIINGKLYLRNKGKIKIGKKVIITSQYSSNPIGGNTFSSIVLDQDAELIIGDETGVSNTAIYCRKKIIIGDRVLIGGDCKIYDTDFHSIKIEQRVSHEDKGISKTVIIEDGVFLGTGVTVLKGSHIGMNSVIGAGSVISGVIPDNEIWAGNPAKFIKKLY